MFVSFNHKCSLPKVPQCFPEDTYFAQGEVGTKEQFCPVKVRSSKPKVRIRLELTKYHFISIMFGEFKLIFAQVGLKIIVSRGFFAVVIRKKSL